MFPVSPADFNVSVVTATATNDDSTIAVTFLFQVTPTTVNFPAGSTVKPGDILVTAYGVAHVYLVSSTQILGM